MTVEKLVKSGDLKWDALFEFNSLAFKAISSWTGSVSWMKWSCLEIGRILCFASSMLGFMELCGVGVNVYLISVSLFCAEKCFWSLMIFKKRWPVILSSNKKKKRSIHPKRIRFHKFLQLFRGKDSQKTSRNNRLKLPTWNNRLELATLCKALEVKTRNIRLI